MIWQDFKKNIYIYVYPSFFIRQQHYFEDPYNNSCTFWYSETSDDPSSMIYVQCTFIVLKYLLRINFFFSWIFHCQFKTGSYSLNWNVMKWNQIPFNIIMPFHKITKIRKLFLKRRYFWAHFRSRRVLKFYQLFWCKIKSFARKNRTESPSFAAFYHIIFIIW